jgi:selenocysteine lyase/cysteine desulfurase
MGESDNIISIPMTIVALKQIEDWGVREINSSLRRITETIIERTHELGLVAPTAEQRAGHMTGLRLVDSTRPNGLKDVQERLAARKVYISVRGDVIRIAPHLSVTDDDIDRLIMELAAVL